MLEKTRVCVVGSRGRMGQRLMRVLSSHPHACVVSEVDVGTDVLAALRVCDVAIDFSAPAACAKTAPLCVQARVGYVVASTGLSLEDMEALKQASSSIPVLQAANTSTGVNVMLELVTLAAQRLGMGFDVELSEIHHRHKKDAPSGTALALARAAQEGRSDLKEVYTRYGETGVRAPEELGFGVLRGGDVSGDHTVYFLGEGERIEITHRSSNADIFAMGAVRAACFLAKQKPGLYSMRDVLSDG
jgi:4-hydroxy-tetrahydrodipicolinate reductase